MLSLSRGTELPREQYRMMSEPKPALKRHQSMADIARLHKLQQLNTTTLLSPENSTRPDSPEEKVLDVPNFLYRLGSQVFLNSTRDTSISSVTSEVPEGVVRHVTGHDIMHLSQDSSSDDDEVSSFDTRSSRAWALIKTILDWPSEPSTEEERQKLRQSRAYDPALLLALVAWII